MLVGVENVWWATSKTAGKVWSCQEGECDLAPKERLKIKMAEKRGKAVSAE